eukprot:SAG31_NODE_1321_length_8801_cov_7.086532_3_plen_215_part_00
MVVASAGARGLQYCCALKREWVRKASLMDSFSGSQPAVDHHAVSLHECCRFQSSSSRVSRCRVQAGCTVANAVLGNRTLHFRAFWTVTKVEHNIDLVPILLHVVVVAVSPGPTLSVQDNLCSSSGRDCDLRDRNVARLLHMAVGCGGELASVKLQHHAWERGKLDGAYQCPLDYAPDRLRRCLASCHCCCSRTAPTACRGSDLHLAASRIPRRP